jgi:hypothetical protein
MAGPDDMVWPPPEWVTPDDVALPTIDWPPASWVSPVGPGVPMRPEDEPPAPAPSFPPWDAPDTTELAPTPTPAALAPSVEAEAQWPPPEWLQDAEPGRELVQPRDVAINEDAFAELGRVYGQPTTEPHPLEQPREAALTVDPFADDEPAGDPLALESERVSQLSAAELAAEDARADVMRQQGAALLAADLEARNQDNIAKALEDRQQSMARVQQRQLELDAKWQEYGQQKIDTGRWWADRSTGQKAANFIAAAIHGWLNPGGANPALDMMQQAIDRDLQAQRMDLETGRASIEGQRGMLADFARITGDLDQAEQAARIAMLESSKNEISQRAAAFDPAGTTARAAEQARRQVEAVQAQAAAKLEADGMEAERKLLEEARKEREFELDQDKAKQDAALGWAANARAKERLAFDKQKHADDEARALAEIEKKADAAAQKGVLLNPLTNQPMSRLRADFGDDPKTVRDVQSRLGAHAMFEENMAELATLVAKSGGRFDVLDRTDRQKAEAIQSNLIAARVKMVSGADATDVEREAHAKSFPATKSLFSTNFADQGSVLDQTRRQSRRDLELQLRGMGVGVGRDPGTGAYTGEAADYFNNLEVDAPAAATPDTATAIREARQDLGYDFDGGISTGVGERQRLKSAVGAVQKLYAPAVEKGAGGTNAELDMLKQISADESVDKKVRAEAQKLAYGAIEHTQDMGAALGWAASLGEKNVFLSDRELKERSVQWVRLVGSMGGQ